MTHLSADTRPPPTGPRLAGIATLLSRPKLIAVGCMIVLIGAGWAYLLSVSLAQGLPGAPGFLDAMCRAVPAGSAGTIGSVAITGAMWIAMTLSMMLPTAGPMILTYAEIAETAACRGEPIVSPHVLIAGYLTVWFGFAGLATLAQLGVMWIGTWPGASAVAAPASALLFLVAGLYQFTSMKHACLTACQRPFSYFFLNWTDRQAGVFRLGMRQGLYCLGCCWAMMLLMFVAGAMNAAWMALLGLVMLIEKMTSSPHVSRAIGIAFTAAALTVAAAWASGFTL